MSDNLYKRAQKESCRIKERERERDRQTDRQRHRYIARIRKGDIM